MIKFYKSISLLTLATLSVLLGGCGPDEMACDNKANMKLIQDQMNEKMTELNEAAFKDGLYITRNPDTNVIFPPITITKSVQTDQNPKGMRTCMVVAQADYGAGMTRDYDLSFFIKNSNDPNITHYVEENKKDANNKKSGNQLARDIKKINRQKRDEAAKAAK